MRLRAFVSASLVLVAGATAFAGCGIPAESNGDVVREDGGTGGGASRGGSGGAKAGASQGGTSAGGKAGTSAGGKGGGTVGSPCKVPADCDDKNDCTADSCLSTGCSYAPLVPGAACDTNRDKCDGVGNCKGSVCVIDPTTVIDATDTDVCTEDLCDPITGQISNPPKVKPGDSTKCTLAFCDPNTGKPVTRDLSIDNDPCTFDECDLSVGPINAPKPTGDGDPCTKDACDKVTGMITHQPIAGCVGCSTSDTPEEQAKVCDDGNPCTVDRCVGGSSGPLCQSVQVPDNTVIDKDGTRCNGTETCVKGKVENLNPKTVDDGLACTIDSCNAATGEVKHEKRNNCIDCESVDDCPQNNPACQSYACEGKPNEGKTCVLKLATGPTCDDGLACTSGDACIVGLCLGSRQQNPSDGQACTVDDKCTEPDGVIVGTDIGGGCISCNGNVDNCGDQTGPGQVAECVEVRCTGGKCEGVPFPNTRPCGPAAANVCEERGRCDGAGKCSGPKRKPNCCLNSGECTAPPAACRMPMVCAPNNTCVQGPLLDCGPPRCDDVNLQKLITPTCNGGTSGVCADVASVCKGPCQDGACVACTASSPDARCTSGFCKNNAECCGTAPPACGTTTDCQKKEGSGCPSCQCTGGKECKPPMVGAGGGGGAAGSGGMGGAGGAPSTVWTCQ